MDSLAKFKAALCRTYPTISDVVMYMADQYSRIVDSEEHVGTLEIEAVIGGLDAKGAFTNHVPQRVVKSLVELLDSFKGWSEVVDWTLIHDHYISNHERVRVVQSKDGRSSDHIIKTSLTSDDFVYKKTGPLGGRVVRMNMKMEQEIEQDRKVLLAFKSVKISVRRAFVIASSNLPKVKFRIELGEYWVGATVAEAEAKRAAGDGFGTIECEIVNAPTSNTLAAQDKLLLFASLWLKVQDLYDYEPTDELCRFTRIVKPQH